MRNPIKMEPNYAAAANPTDPTATPRRALHGAEIRHGIPNELHTLMADIVHLLKHANQGSDAELSQAKHQLQASLRATQCALQAINTSTDFATRPSAWPPRSGASAPQCTSAAP